MGARLFAAALAAAAALILPPAAGALQRRSEGIRSDGPQRRDWTQTAAHTPEGIRMGDPDARVRVIEYLSPGCGECARFVAEGGETLFQQYVRNGRVSIEYRPYTQNAFDLAATFVARCARPTDYFDMTHYMLGHQPDWMGRAQALTEAQRNELRGLPMFQAVQRLVPMLGLDRVAQRYGVDRTALQTCIADQAGFDRLNALQQAAQQQNIAAPPAFFINGARAQAASWAELEPQIRAALGSGS